MSAALPTHLSADCEDTNLIALADRLLKMNTEEDAIGVINITDSLINTEIFKKLPDCRIKCEILYERAWAYKGLSNYEYALELYLKSIECAKKEGHHDLEAKAYIAIALIHEFLSNSADCKRNLERAKEVIDTYETNTILPFYYVRLSSFHFRFSNREKAKHFANLAIIEAKKYGDRRNEIDGHILLGLTHSDLDKKLKHFNISVTLFIELGSYYGAASQTFNIIKIYTQNGRKNETSSYVDQLGEYLSKTNPYHKGYYVIMGEYLSLRKQEYEEKNILDSVKVYAERLENLTRQSAIITDKRKLSQMEIKFAVDQEKFKTQAAEDRERFLRITLYLGGTLFLGLGLLSFITYRNKKQIKQQNSLITTQNQRLLESNRKYEMLLSEVHHRVKNNLQNVISLLVLQQFNSDDELVKRKLGDISSKVHSIALIHEQLYRAGEYDKINLKEYFEELFKHFENLQYAPDQFISKVESNELKLNLETVIPLGIICSELISNSIKYGKHNEAVAVSLTVKELLPGEYQWEFRDQGPGFPEDHKVDASKGLGLLLIKGLVRQLNARVQKYNDNGAVVKIIFREKISSVL